MPPRSHFPSNILSSKDTEKNMIPLPEKGKKRLAAGTSNSLSKRSQSDTPKKRNTSTTSSMTLIFFLVCIIQQVIISRQLLLSSISWDPEGTAVGVLPHFGRVPYNIQVGFYKPKELPFIATVTEVVHPIAYDSEAKTPASFFELLQRNYCLPSDALCIHCLRNQEGADCTICANVCSCYCENLCYVPVEERPIRKSISVHPPAYSKDPSRLIPRIIHQTWFEDIHPDKYPNMSRMMESFRRSGWDYRFYTDDESLEFIKTHFPEEISEAYEALLPGAFKADLFRYCVLLIHGGLYADLDVMLETNLDFAIADDIGFMVPMDAPGAQAGHRMCLWNGFLAAAPAHPFLAQTIERVVNAARNRYTGVDFDQDFCPNPELSVLHAYDILFQAGPCMLGASVNEVLGRNRQTSYEAGFLSFPDDIYDFELGEDSVESNEDRVQIPGQSIILMQNKHDMGAQRFTDIDRNLVIAATDFPDDDRSKQANPSEHYSKTQPMFGIYGVEKVYSDRKAANEDIKIYVARK